MSMMEMKLSFQTERLNVFAMTLTPADFNTERIIFLGFRRDVDCPRVAVNVMLMPPSPVFNFYYIDWIETSESFRRDGLAREMWLGIEKYLGAPIEGEGASNAGEALCEHMEEQR